MTNAFFAPGKCHYMQYLHSYYVSVCTVGIILYYIVICFYITGSQASILVVIVKTVVVLVR